METKTYNATLNFKASEEPGEFEAVFATLNVVDHDGDVTIPGAFGEQRVLIEPWNHGYQSPPVGKGEILERGEEAVVQGRYFLETAAGQEHYVVAKQLGDMQEWSYTFNILDSEYGEVQGRKIRFLKQLEVIGVGQVGRGAGINTRTLVVKEKQSSSEGDEGEGGGEDSAVKPSGPDADLLTEIRITEIGLIALEVEQNG